MEFKGWITNGYANCERNFYFEIDDEDLEGMSQKDIEEIASEAMHEEIEWGYSRVKDIT